MPRETDQQRKLRRVAEEAKAAEQKSQSHSTQSKPTPPQESPSQSQNQDQANQSSQPQAQAAADSSETQNTQQPENSAPIAENPSTNHLPEQSAETGMEELPEWVKIRRANAARRSLTSNQAPVDPNQLSPEIPALQSLVYQLLSTKKAADQQFYVVVVPEDAKPHVRAFEDASEMITAINELLGTPVSIFPFMGYKLGITKGPNRFISTPYGALPLFVIPKVGEMEFEEDGYVGEESTELEIPAASTMSVMDEEEEVEDNQYIEEGVYQEPDDTPALPEIDA
jgi:DNA mismatch repair ATPase MutL